MHSIYSQEAKIIILCSVKYNIKANAYSQYKTANKVHNELFHPFPSLGPEKLFQ